MLLDVEFFRLSLQYVRNNISCRHRWANRSRAISQMADLLRKVEEWPVLVADHPIKRVDKLLPWNLAPQFDQLRAAADDGDTARIYQFPGSLAVRQLNRMVCAAKFLRTLTSAVNTDPEVPDPGKQIFSHGPGCVRRGKWAI